MSSPPSGAGRARVLRIVGVAISVLSLAGVVLWAMNQPVPDLPTDSSGLLALAVALSVYACATIARGERAYRLLSHAKTAVKRRDAIGLTVVGYMGNTVLPARGGDAIRAYLQAPRAHTSVRSVIGILVAERVLDVLTLLGLFVLLAYGVLRGIEAPSTTALVAAAALPVFVLLSAFAVLRFLGENERVRSVTGFLAPMAEATRSLRASHGMKMLALTVIIWLLEAATWFAVSEAVRLDMSPIEALYLVALASVFVLVPSGPGYAGTLDAAVLFGANAIGATGAEALAYLISLRFILLLPITLCGVALLVTRYGGLADAWQRRDAAIR